MPKAAIIKQNRFYWMALGMGNTFGVTHNDRLYITMPMYHSAAGILGIFPKLFWEFFPIFSGIGQVYMLGCSAAICRKFSASRFWDDCIKYECTVRSQTRLRAPPDLIF